MLSRSLNTAPEPVSLWYRLTPVERARLPLQHVYEEYGSFRALVDGIPESCIESIRQLLALAEDDPQVYRLFTEKARLELARMNALFLREAERSESPAMIATHQEVFLELQDILGDAWYAQALLRLMKLEPSIDPAAADLLSPLSEQSGVRRVI